VAHHRLLQFVSLPALGDRALLDAEAARLLAEGRLSDAELAALDLDALADFGRSELGRRVQAEAAFARRELEFTARLSPADFAELALPCEPGLAPDEFVVVQGVVDLAVIAPAHVWIVDFKTDRVNAGTVEARAADYASQLRLYARALGRIYARPVTGAWLHFLAIHRSVAVPLA
jgi:ATP-dependent helicase/nuclease subunit A